VERAAVFARASPTHKLKIVEALQEKGHIVAMTGDGVNDAPALRQADIGIAMGIRGTDVAKASSDMVIVDDNFATIVGAVEQGRIVVNNILRFVHYLLSCNFAEIMTMFVAIMVGWPLPLTVLQILWLNMVTDIFPATALALEPSAPDVMRQKPRAPSAPLLTLSSWWRVAWQGFVLTAATLLSFAVALRWYGGDVDGDAHAGTVAFSTLAIAQTLHVFNARSEVRSAFSQLFSNTWLWGAVVLCIVLQVVAVSVPFLRGVLGATPLTLVDVALIAATSALPVAFVEVVKGVPAVMRRLGYRKAATAPGFQHR
jgi:Ca2+-transporting ATPase